jgi:FkbM family methyltransferase
VSIRLEFVKAVNRLPKEPVIIEIGSHVGDGVKYILKKRPKANVYAIEPSRKSFKKLRKFHKNSFNIAISNNIRDAKIVERKNSRRNIVAKMGARVIKQLPLDDFMTLNSISAADMIRFDCYGAEYRIFHTNNEFLGVTDMIYITMHKQKVCPKIKVKRERSHIKTCLRGAGFKLIASGGKGAGKHLYQLWRKP